MIHQRLALGPWVEWRSCSLWTFHRTMEWLMSTYRKWKLMKKSAFKFTKGIDGYYWVVIAYIPYYISKWRHQNVDEGFPVSVTPVTSDVRMLISVTDFRMSTNELISFRLSNVKIMMYLVRLENKSNLFEYSQNIFLACRHFASSVWNIISIFFTEMLRIISMVWWFSCTMCLNWDRTSHKIT